MSFREDLEVVLDEAVNYLGVFDPDFFPDTWGVKLASDEVIDVGRWWRTKGEEKEYTVEQRLAVYLRTIDGVPEYAGVTYRRGHGDDEPPEWTDSDVAVVDVEPELRQVWTVKR